MRKVTLLFGLILSLFTVTVMAGSGHDHGHGHSKTPVNIATAESNATKIVATIVKKNKLDKSWASVTASSIDKKVVKGNTEWEVIFINEKITDVKKQKLYVYLTLSGDYIAANHTGQ